MTDFFSDLERQLVDATAQRPRRMRRARQRRVAALSTILVAVLAAGAGLAAALSGSGAGSAAGTTRHPVTVIPSTGPQRTVPGGGAPLGRGSYTVAVLNATTVPGLARGVANRLQNTKFKIGNVTNAAGQDRSATLVEFAPGHRAEADSVAKAIDVGSGAIQPLSAGSKTIAGDQATVVVLVGTDQNTSPTG